MTRALLLTSAYALALLGASGCRPHDPTAKVLRSTVSNAVAPPSIQGSRWKLVQQVYRDRDYRPLWIDGRKVRGQARDLIETLCHAEREGLRAADYDLPGLRIELAQLRNEKDPAPGTAAALDLRLTRSFLDYGADLLSGRHVYGDAADIYVDENGDGTMDDLNGDGQTTLDDARALASVVEGLSQKSWYQPFEGGLGLYDANPAHGPFVHVDVRGYPARWGPRASGR